jgi:hypothetical protein
LFNSSIDALEQQRRHLCTDRDLPAAQEIEERLGRVRELGDRSQTERRRTALDRVSGAKYIVDHFVRIALCLVEREQTALDLGQCFDRFFEKGADQLLLYVSETLCHAGTLILKARRFARSRAQTEKLAHTRELRAQLHRCRRGSEAHVATVPPHVEHERGHDLQAGGVDPHDRTEIERDGRAVLERAQQLLPPLAQRLDADFSRQADRAGAGHAWIEQIGHIAT